MSIVENHEHDEAAWEKHRGRFAPKRITVHGQSLATWAKVLINAEAARVSSALSIGISQGLDPFEIGHKIVGSRKLNGSNGVTEITRQNILRIGAGFLRKRKIGMARVKPNGSA